jgi:hypothetical protein
MPPSYAHLPWQWLPACPACAAAQQQLTTAVALTVLRAHPLSPPAELVPRHASRRADWTFATVIQAIQTWMAQHVGDVPDVRAYRSRDRVLPTLLSLYRLTGTGQLDAAYAVLETHGLHLCDAYRAQRHARLVAAGRRGSITSLRKTTHLTANVPEGACYAR